MTDLGQALAESFRPRPVAPDIRARRERLCELIRRNEPRVYDTAHPRAATVRTLLGWDDETMAHFVDSPLLCHSSPHASMNSFPPMLAFPWILGRAVELAQRRHGAVAVHVRTQCTHHNFNDTFSKPHAWWHRDPAGEVVKTTVFTRVPIKFHPVLCKPAPRLLDEPMHEVDRAAIELAELATGYAGYSIIYRMYLERLAGFHADRRVIEIPIDLLNRFTIEELGLRAWFEALAAAGMSLRMECGNAPLAVMTREDLESIVRDGERSFPGAVVAPNTINFAQFYLLGLSLMVGGRRMARYVSGMNQDIEKFMAGVDGWRYQEPAFLPFTRIPFSEALGLQKEAAYCQREYGFATSLSLVASALRGKAADRLSGLLAMDYASLYDPTVV